MNDNDMAFAASDSGSLRRHRLLTALLAERAEWQGATLPATQGEQRLLLRALCNVRQPHAVSSEWLGLQDEELQCQLAEKGIVEVSQTQAAALDSRLRLWQGDITRLGADAIVNAANSQMLGCFVPNHRCIDNAIHSAAGVQLRQECSELMRRQGHDEPTGSAKITRGYNLPARHVIHTVGAIVPTGIPTAQQAQQLASCYRSCLGIASESGLQSIAFCCISTGEFRYPNGKAAEIAVSAVRSWLDSHPATSITSVIFNVFKDIDYELYRQILFPAK